jgi:hypothetical protein
MNNAVGFLLQSALANPAHLNAAAVLQHNPTRGIGPTPWIITPSQDPIRDFCELGHPDYIWRAWRKHVLQVMCSMIRLEKMI